MYIEVLKCKCGALFAGTSEPENEDWESDVAKYVAAGCSVVTMKAGTFQLAKCRCKEYTPPSIPSTSLSDRMKLSHLEKVWDKYTWVQFETLLPE